MEWDKIQETVYEIQELQLAALSKLANPIMHDIIDRNIICTDIRFNPKDLNNAILENKFRVVPLQMLLLQKITDQNLPLDITDVYNGMPEDIDTIESYVNELKNKFILVDKTLDLISNIDTISEMELENDSFESNEYMKMYNMHLDMVTPEFKINIIKDRDKEKNKIMNQISTYVSSLSETERANLYIQSLALSYDRNRAIFLANFKLNQHYQQKGISNMGTLCDILHDYIEFLEVTLLEQEPLETIYKDLSCIYTSSFYKQKMKKKSV